YDADIVAIAAGVGQKPGETRISLLNRNAAIFRKVISEVIKSGFDGVFLVATNPVDIMTRIVIRESGFDPRRVIGTGTTLDSARLRYLLGDYFSVDSRNIHAYVIGEHGDSEFVPWSQAMVGTKSVIAVCRAHGEYYCMDELMKIGEDVKNAAYKIIEAKRATYYGIGMAMTRITKAVLGDENSILTVSTQLDGEYGISGVCVGAPSIVGRNGVLEHISLDLTEEELSRFRSSCEYLDRTYAEMLEQEGAAE
ncbi:MAG: L-lactate dehydrogenase, partial [Clostridia bacterium]|nr:L-lactate dehydrogenase [Clostridia bacterium]